MVGASGTLSPGNSIGTLTINNTLDLLGETVMEINKSGAVYTNDLVQGVSTLTYGGKLTVLASGDPLAAGDVWDLFDATTFVNTFSTFDLPALTGGLTWNTSNLSSTGQIQIIPEPGTLALLATGLIGLLAYAWRKRK